MTDQPAPTSRHVTWMTDHYRAHPEWTPGRRYYTWFLTFEAHPDVHRLARHYQHHLHHLHHLHLVPLQWLHLTLQGIGDTTDVTKQEADRIAAHASITCAQLPPLHLTLGPARAAAEAIMLDITPHHPLTHLRHTLHTAIADVRGADHTPTPSHPFTPHVSLAYNHTDRPAHPAIHTIEHHPTHPATATITTIKLLTLQRTTCTYHWHTHTTIPLGHR